MLKKYQKYQNYHIKNYYNNDIWSEDGYTVNNDGETGWQFICD